jgi:hypothetical protein
MLDLIPFIPLCLALIVLLIILARQDAKARAALTEIATLGETHHSFTAARIARQALGTRART